MGETIRAPGPSAMVRHSYAQEVPAEAAPVDKAAPVAPAAPADKAASSAPTTEKADPITSSTTTTAPDAQAAPADTVTPISNDAPPVPGFVKTAADSKSEAG